MSEHPEIGAGPLRATLEYHRLADGASLSDLTVLSSQRDPFRVDTPANHRDARWLAEAVDELLPAGRTVHLRGLHYALLGRTKPDGQPYHNDDKTWLWLSEKAAKAARWLGYIPFSAIVDQRNAEPVVRLAETEPPTPLLDLGKVRVELPVDIAEPTISMWFGDGQQPYSLAIYGEKSSLEPVLGPLAEQYDASLFLPTGEISDTLMHRMAKAAADDDRPLVVFTFSDCDPAGWQMTVSISRKLQALAAGVFPGLQFEVRRVGLLPEHVKEYGLPSTPLKATEKRGGKWVRETGVQQTEIDAMATLQPDLLREIATAELDLYYDHSLQLRSDLAMQRWQEQAQAMLHELIGPERLAAFRSQAQERLDSMREQLRAINDGLRIDVSDLDLPEYTPPQAVVPGVSTPPLVSSAWTFPEQCAALKLSKNYGGGDD